LAEAVQAKKIEIGNATVGGDSFALIGGPCVIESEAVALETARHAASLCRELGIPYIYKSSYLKDNRSSHETYQGPGAEKGLAILSRVREEVGVPVLSDVHTPGEAAAAGEALDCLQLPAYLSKQTQLALALAATGKPVNIKKAQFFKPEQVAVPVRKIEAAGNRQIVITERGTAFGYGDIVFDPRSLVILRRFGYPVFFDVTHIVRLPGATSDDPAGGLRDYIFPLARAACGAGIDGLFLEFHPEPERALCDAASMLPMDRLEEILRQCLEIHSRVKGWPDS
jgi:2-dehydro-3-deoxyphosphooctonate aldolase (KDO 8-P synthase)